MFGPQNKRAILASFTETLNPCNTIFIQEGSSSSWCGWNNSSPQNDNYLSILELLSLFDDFLSAHIVKHANHGKGSTSYLSSTICDELITMLGTDVRKHIISEIENTKYFSLMLDSTPVVSHTDQFTMILHFMDKDG